MPVCTYSQPDVECVYVLQGHLSKRTAALTGPFGNLQSRKLASPPHVYMLKRRRNMTPLATACVQLDGMTHAEQTP